MKKMVTLGFALLASVAVMTGCSSTPKADGKTAEGYLYKISGSSSSSKVYYKTAADGTKSAKVKKGKFVIDELPKRLHKYTVKIANDSDFDKTTEVTVPAAKSIGTVEDVTDGYESEYETYDSLSSMADISNFGEEGVHKVTTENGVDVKASINDGHVMGIELYWPLTNDDDAADTLSDTLFAFTHGMGGDTSTVQKLITNTTKSANDGQTLTTKTGGMTVEGIGMKGAFLLFRIYK